MSLPEALRLPCDLFLLCYKNCVTERLMQTEEGRARLEYIERCKQTKLDKDGLHRLMERLRNDGLA